MAADTALDALSIGVDLGAHIGRPYANRFKYASAGSKNDVFMSAYVYVRSKTTFFGSSSVCNKRNKPSARYQSCTEGAMNVFGRFVNARSVRYCFGRSSKLYKDINYRCFALRSSAKRSKTIFWSLSTCDAIFMCCLELQRLGDTFIWSL